MKPLLNDTVAGTVLDAHGRPIYLPATILSPEQARLIRAISVVGDHRGIRARLYCETCWGGDLKHHMEVNVESDQLSLICRHRQLFYLGETTLPLMDPPSSDTLSADEASMFRQLRQVLLTHGLKMAYYCNDCLDNGVPDGMRGHVTESEIEFVCRHRTLRHRGMSH